jgi:ribosome-associated translation inhibitor RaiA
VDVAVVAEKDVAPEGVRVLVRRKLAVLGRRAPMLEQAEVRLAEDRKGAAPGVVCEVRVEGHGHRLRARAVAADAAGAVDLVVGKLGHQAERLKGKVLGRSHPRRRRRVLA